MFWIISALLILIAFAILIPPMLRKHESDNNARRAQNIQIANEQLTELEKSFEDGELSHDEYQNARNELELTLFTNAKDDDTHLKEAAKAPVLSIIVIVLFIPILSVLLYQKLGNKVYTTGFDSKAIAAENQKNVVPRNADGTPDIDTMVAGLQKKLEAEPNNPKGWYMLGRSYMVLKRFPEAVKAYEKAYKLMPESAEVMLSLADSLAMLNQGDIAGRPVELINKALKIEPNNLTALWLGGMAARQKKDYVSAIQRWSKVMGILKDPGERKEVMTLIKEAESKLSPEQHKIVKADLDSLKTITKSPPPLKAIPNTVANTNTTNNTSADPKKSVTVNVSISDQFKDKVNPTDTIFVYAKAMSGPPMPLAAAKIQVKDLPIEITLNDSMAMMPQMKISGHSEVVVGARISKSGQPVAQSGDFYTEKRAIKLGDKANLKIDTIKQ